MDDRSIRIAVLLSAHIIFLSAGALRIVRGRRGHLVRTEAPWWVQYYPPVVWLPFLVAYAQVAWFAGLLPSVELGTRTQLIGLGIALASAIFAAWGMWSLGRSYGIRLDLFEGHTLKTDGPFALVRHPMYVGIVAFHIGTALALQSVPLLLLTGLVVVPLTVVRIAAEERVLGDAFPAHAAYASRVPALVPRVIGSR